MQIAAFQTHLNLIIVVHFEIIKKNFSEYVSEYENDTNCITLGRRLK